MNVYLRMCRPTPILRLAFRQARIQAGRARGASQVSRGNAFLPPERVHTYAHIKQRSKTCRFQVCIYIPVLLLMYRVCSTLLFQDSGGCVTLRSSASRADQTYGTAELYKQRCWLSAAKAWVAWCEASRVGLSVATLPSNLAEYYVRFVCHIHRV